MPSNDALKTYLKAISQTPLLTHEQEVELACLSRKGDWDARRKLVEANLLFVVKIAKEYMNQGMPLLDLIQEGNLGLMNAMNRFDERLGFRLTTYASWWIRLSIRRAIQQKVRQIRLPTNKVELLRKVKAFGYAYERQHGRQPNLKEIARHFRMRESQVKAALDLDSQFTSFETPVTEEGMSYEQLLHNEEIETPSSSIHSEQMKSKLERAMDVLSTKEKDVLEMRFGLNGYHEGASLREVGKRMGLSAEGVRRIESQALSKLRRPQVSSRVECFL